MKEWLVVALLADMVAKITPHTKVRIVKSFLYTLASVIGLIIAFAIFAYSPTAFFSLLGFGAIWGWIFSNMKDRNY